MLHYPSLRVKDLPLSLTGTVMEHSRMSHDYTYHMYHLNKKGSNQKLSLQINTKLIHCSIYGRSI